MEYTKKDEVTLQVTKPVEVAEQTFTYDLDFLRNQEVAILRQLNDFVDARNRELDEVRSLLKKCDELGVKSAVEVALAAEQVRAGEVETVAPAEVKS